MMKMQVYCSRNLRYGTRAGRSPRRECSPRMQGIPIRTCLRRPATARRVDAKALDEAVPYRLVVPDQNSFPERDPNVVHDEEPTLKFAQSYVWMPRLFGVLLYLLD